MTDDERSAEPERRRPVGGAAAWRRHDEPPVRAADDHQPEKVRYRRASVAEQLSDGTRELLRNRGAVAILALVFGGFVVLRLLTPEAVAFGTLAAGDCIYVRTGAVGDERPVGPTGAVRDQLLSRGAERAPCNLTHGHEVTGVVDLVRAGDAWPGEAALTEQVKPACDEAAAAISASRAAGAPTLTVATIVPDEERWSEGMRRGACLVHRTDGQFLTEHVLAP